MVSTRQMATSNGGTSNNNHNSASSSGNTTTINNITADETARLSVVTRQTSSNCMLAPSTSAGAVAAAVVAGVAAVVNATTPTSAARHTNLTQAVKANGGSAAGVSSQNIVVASGCGSGGGGGAAGGGGGNDEPVSEMHLLELPVEILSKIFSYMDYKRIGQLRVTSQKMNDVCMSLLNSTFSKLITQTYNHFHAIKANMPRRESARRNHPLACECDIIETCYMRLSLLQMTIGKHIERGHCCFFPGAILDEVYVILNYVKNTPCLERPYRVTDELFDLSTMAMEYFRDRIESTLPGIAYFNKEFFKLPATKRPTLVIASDLTDSSSSSLPSPPQSMVLRKGIRKIKEGMKIYNNQLSVLRNELRTCKRKSSEQGKQMAEQQKLLAEQQKQTLEYANRLDENDKKNEEIARKFSTLLQELNKCKTELQYWRSKSPAIPTTCASCGQKVVAVLPPEDYQALISSGVKPEDIILNLNDESDASLLLNADVDEFVFPDEATTAKLLTVSTAAKNLKRQHTSTSSNNSNNNNNDGGAGASKDDGIVAAASERPTEIANCLVYAKGGHIIRATCTMAATAAMTATSTATPMAVDATPTTTTTQPHFPHGKDLNASDAATAAAAVAANLTPPPTCDGDNGDGGGGDSAGGYSTKSFSGTANNMQKSVIVTPVMLAANRPPIAVSGSPEGGGDMKQLTLAVDSVGAMKTNYGATTSAAAAAVVAVAAVENVVALQAIKSHETKKARRVQKATRCASGGGTKRSK